METFNQDEFSHENKAWAKSLEFLEQENSTLKNKLSAVVDNKDGKDFIVMAEYFQNEFILKDEVIHELKKDIVDLWEYLSKNFTNTYATNMIALRQERLRGDICSFEKDFATLKQEFNNSISNFL